MWFGDDPDKATLRETLRSTLDAACQALPQAFDPTPLRRQIAALKDLPLKATMDACTRLEGSEGDGDVLSVLAHGRDVVVRRTRDLMRAYDAFLDRYVTAVETRLAQLGDDPLADAIEGVREELAGIRTGLATLGEDPS